MLKNHQDFSFFADPFKFELGRNLKKIFIIDKFIFHTLCASPRVVCVFLVHLLREWDRENEPGKEVGFTQ